MNAWFEHSEVKLCPILTCLDMLCDDMMLINVSTTVPLFSRISQNLNENKMSANNSATCWWPTLTRPDFKNVEDINRLAPLKIFQSFCTSNAPELFRTDELE